MHPVGLNVYILLSCVLLLRSRSLNLLSPPPPLISPPILMLTDAVRLSTYAYAWRISEAHGLAHCHLILLQGLSRWRRPQHGPLVLLPAGRASR